MIFMLTALTSLTAIRFAVASSSHELLLHTGAVTPEANLGSFMTDQNVDQSEIFENSYFRLIQFNEIPGENVIRDLSDNGIRLIQYIPNNAYTAQIDIDAKLKSLERSNVRSVVRIESQWKISDDLATGNIAEHAWINGSDINVVVKYHKGLSSQSVVDHLTSAGFELLNRYDYGNWVQVRLPESKINDLAQYPYVDHFDIVAPPSVPDDTRGRSLHRSNVISSDMPMGRHYDGTGVSAALADDGAVGPHIDYTGRLDQSNVTSPGLGGSHGDMTAGILCGAGNLDPTIRGMAVGTYIYIYDISGYTHILNSPTTNQTLGVMVTSTSYSQGCNEYTTDTQTGDMILHDNPTLLHVYSAGNSASSNCGYGASGYGNITGGYKQGKNVIACANLDYLGVRTASSSRGPAHDGRIKPDISANGTNQLSTDDNNTYQVGGGTSAACPGIAGIVTQLQHAHRDLNGGQSAEGALIKACLFNTAEDYGNAGPDFNFGWGRVNAYRAVRVLEDIRYLSDSVSQGTNNQHTVTVPANTQQVRVMIHWTDVEGSPVASKALVNDINMTLTDPNGTVYEPWVLDPTPTIAALTAPAVRGVDDLNNTEQVTLDNPPSGTYTVDVSGFAIPQGPQKYYLVWEFITDEIEVTYPIGGEGFVPGETETIRWDRFGTSGTYTLEYSVDGGSTWTVISGSVAGSQESYDWVVPAVVTGEAKVRVSRNGITGESQENFTIIDTPSNIVVDWACPDSIRLVWTGVTGAIGYEVSMLGAMYMDSVGYSTSTDIILTGINPTQDYWFSVKAYAPNGNKGRRAEAVYKAPGVFSCPIAIDASVAQVNSPAAGILQDCMDLSNLQVSIEIENEGLNQISNVPVFYSVNNNTPVAETYAGPLASFASDTYVFTSTVNLQTPGTYNVKVWVAYPSDGNTYNDTTEVTIEVIGGSLKTLPYSEDFESFSTCPTTNNCGATVCVLSNGWINEVSGDSDDTDWRTQDGPTPSQDTGPSVDHNPGTANGNYLYTEASNCFNQLAVLVSPCIDLTTATSPEFEFWYHMYGATMGTMHIDVLFNDVWQLDVIPPLSGNQGNQWNQAIINLVPFVGDIINVRFRGETGTSWTSDMAIDDINVYEVQAPPVAAFSASSTDICVGETITLFDNSLNSPNTWDWTLNPSAGYSFVNGTSSTSQNPEIEFTSPGSYDVTLMVGNGFGSGSTTINSYIEVGVSAATPFVETFQSGVFPPASWDIDNPDLSTTWQERTNIPGSTGTNTNAAWMNNFTYNAAGEEDGLITQKVDLTSTVNPIMTFDVAYVPYSATFWDGLRIDISLDCGVTYNPTSYYKENLTLATAPINTGNWTPTGAGDWRNDTLDLSFANGNVVILKFVNINGYGNSLFIDNINFDDVPLGLNETDIAGTVLVYPNPGTGLFYLDLSGKEVKECRISVTDARGRIVHEEFVDAFKQNGAYTLDLNNADQGIYFIKVDAGDRLFTGKVSVQR